MIIRNFQKSDLTQAEEIFALYFTDSEFLREFSSALKICIGKTEENIDEKYKFFVAEDKNEIVGIIGFKNIPDYIKKYAKTDRPTELYIIAVKHKNKGTGGMLMEEVKKEIKKLGYTEILLYSPDTHKESWSFYDASGECVGKEIDPDGYTGQIWRIIL